MSLTAYPVTDEKDLDEIYRLRYKVFCYEWGFEKPDDYPDERVTDVYDKHSLHFAVRGDREKIVGAVSLILNSPEGFPAEKYCELDINTSDLPRNSIAEVSRLVVHRDYRRRAEDKYIYGPDEERRSIGSFHYPASYQPPNNFSRRADDRYRGRAPRRQIEPYTDRRRRHEVVFSLYRAMYQESRRRQISHWYSIMTKGIVILLQKFGFSFEAIGDPVDFRGIRTPYLAVIEKMEQDLSVSNPSVYEDLNGGDGNSDGR